jgi:hypothetical protein
VVRVVEAVVAEAEIAVVVAETVNGAVVTVLKHKERIVIEEDTIKVHAKIRMVLSSKERKMNEEVAEAVVATMATVAAGAIEVKEVASAAATVVAATEGAAIVPEKRVRPNQLSNNNKLSEHHR